MDQRVSTRSVRCSWALSPRGAGWSDAVQAQLFQTASRMRVTDFPPPRGYGYGKTTKRINAVISGLRRRDQDFSALTNTQKSKWTNVLKHSRYDVEALEHLETLVEMTDHLFLSERLKHSATLPPSSSQRRVTRYGIRTLEGENFMAVMIEAISVVSEPQPLKFRIPEAFGSICIFQMVLYVLISYKGRLW